MSRFVIRYRWTKDGPVTEHPFTAATYEAAEEEFDLNWKWMLSCNRPEAEAELIHFSPVTIRTRSMK